jgi:hypothetical protein
MLRRVIIGVFCLIICGIGRAEQPPFAYEPSLAKRISYSEVVCSGTIVKTEKTGKKEMIGGADRDEFIAEADVGQVFKGNLSSHAVRFRYFNFGAYPTPEFITPPIASFDVGSRYIIFLRSRETNLEVAVPVWQMEIPLGPKLSSEAASVPPSLAGIAEELFDSIKSQPKTLGRTATHYFSWAKEVVGKNAVPAVEYFLVSDDDLVRYQAAWWLSFREITSPVINILLDTSNNSSVETWARSESERRLEDIHKGNWVPK